MAKTSEAQMRAVANWGKENQDRVEVRIRKGMKDEWRSYCDQLGMSMSAMVSQAVYEYAERMGLEPPAPAGPADPEE